MFLLKEVFFDNALCVQDIFFIKEDGFNVPANFQFCHGMKEQVCFFPLCLDVHNYYQSPNRACAFCTTDGRAAAAAAANKGRGERIE